MAISVFDLFKIGVGPSSSHTVGPMRAGALFVQGLRERGELERVKRIEVRLYGSLSATGIGHGTDNATIMGLMGEWPDAIDPTQIVPRIADLRETNTLQLDSRLPIEFVWARDMLLLDENLPYHPNAMTLIAEGEQGELHRDTYYSVGGGFVVDAQAQGQGAAPGVAVPYAFRSGDELLALCRDTGLSISELMRANEAVFRPADQTSAAIANLWAVMQACVQSGCSREGVLPGALNIRRRAPQLARDLHAHPQAGLLDPLVVLDWVSLYALAVNEENAAGGRVVTAPTNGAAGIVPAVLHYYTRFVNGASAEGVERFLLTAAAIAILYKENASISGAEVGCQGEVGVACSMAAGALAEVLGGTPLQVENAAEIGMEHNLGLTCDPVGGRVQVPCIERNAMGAVKALHAARMALRGDGKHYVSLDKVIKTMAQTGADMKTQYKETSRGGLAVNVIEC